jgi:hypothetical protein
MVDAVSARAGIENTLARYSWSFARGDFEQLESCFAAEADVVFPDLHHATGRPDVMKKLRSLSEKFTGSDTMGWIVIANLLILEETADEAQTIAFYTSFSGVPGTPAVSSVGWYEDVFANEDGAWRIKQRRVRPNGAR